MNKSDFLVSMHKDLLPFLKLASVEDLGAFALAQINLAIGEELPQLTGIAKALFDAQTAMDNRFEIMRQQKSNAGKKSAEQHANNTNGVLKHNVSSVATHPQQTFNTALTHPQPDTESETITETVKGEKPIVGQSPTACTAARLNESQKPDDFIKATAVDKAERKADIECIVAHLNQTIGTRYSPTSKSTANHINARLNEGFKLDDFITVIDKKAAEWVGTDRAQYLRPETLFGTKFEGYLNAPYPNTQKNGLSGNNAPVISTAAAKKAAEIAAIGNWGVVENNAENCYA